MLAPAKVRSDSASLALCQVGQGPGLLFSPLLSSGQLPALSTFPLPPSHAPQPRATLRKVDGPYAALRASPRQEAALPTNGSSHPGRPFPGALASVAHSAPRRNPGAGEPSSLRARAQLSGPCTLVLHIASRKPEPQVDSHFLPITPGFHACDRTPGPLFPTKTSIHRHPELLIWLPGLSSPPHRSPPSQHLKMPRPCRSCACLAPAWL